MTVAHSGLRPGPVGPGADSPDFRVRVFRISIVPVVARSAAVQSTSSER